MPANNVSRQSYQELAATLEQKTYFMEDLARFVSLSPGIVHLEAADLRRHAPCLAVVTTSFAYS